MNVDMNNVRASMAEHWDMTGEEFDAHTVNSFFDQGEGWQEIDFVNADGWTSFFIEVDADGEVWNFERLVSPVT